jgi:hypothetical protein
MITITNLTSLKTQTIKAYKLFLTAFRNKKVMARTKKRSKNKIISSNSIAKATLANLFTQRQ